MNAWKKGAVGFVLYALWPTSVVACAAQALRQPSGMQPQACAISDPQQLERYVAALEKETTHSPLLGCLAHQQALRFFTQTGSRDFAGALSFAGLLVIRKPQEARTWVPLYPEIGRKQARASLAPLWDDPLFHLSQIRGDLGAHPLEKARAFSDLYAIGDFMCAWCAHAHIKRPDLEGMLQDPDLKEIFVKAVIQWWHALDTLSEKMRALDTFVPAAEILSMVHEEETSLRLRLEAYQRSAGLQACVAGPSWAEKAAEEM